MGSDLVYSILSPEWNADKTRVDRFVIGLQSRLFQIEFVQVGVYGGGWIYGEAGSGQDSNYNILTLDALQVLSRSQVTWSCVHADTADM
jgi:hypothetical protein